MEGRPSLGWLDCSGDRLAVTLITRPKGRPELRPVPWLLAVSRVWEAGSQAAFLYMDALRCMGPNVVVT